MYYKSILAFLILILAALFKINTVNAQDYPYLYNLLKESQEKKTSNSYIQLGKYYDSLSYNEKSLEYYANVPLEDFKNSDLKWNYIFSKALFYKKRKSYRQSNRLAKVLVKGTKHKELYQLNSFLLMADNYVKLYNIDSSAKYYNQAFNYIQSSSTYQPLSSIIINNLEYLCYNKYPNDKHARKNCEFISSNMETLDPINNKIDSFSRAINIAYDLIAEREFDTAQVLLDKIMTHIEENGQLKYYGEIKNFMAVNDLISGDLAGAKINVNESIENTKYTERYWDLINSYKIAMRIAELEGDNATYQNMLFLHEQVKNKASTEALKKEQEENDKKEELNVEERRMLDLLNQNTIIEAQKRQLQLEAERSAQEKQLVEARLEQIRQQAEIDKALRETQRLENERTKQLLEQQKIEAAKADAERKLAQSNEEQAKRELELQKSRVELELAENEKENRNRITLYSSIAAGIVLLGLLGFLLFVRRRNKLLTSLNEEIEQQKTELEKTTEELEISKKKVDQSINAAKYIQHAMLPDDDLFDKFFYNHFRMYKPKDIVSGDFYWAEEHNDNLHFAIVDCTGHGIPGALVSMIARAILNKVFAVTPDITLNKALDEAHSEIYTQLRQGSKGEGGRVNKDGMDMALCSCRKDNEKLIFRYCGARRPLILLRNGAEDLEVIKGTRRGLGGVQNMKRVFEEHTLELNKGDRFFLYSDGLSDQFNINNKKIYEKGVINRIREGAGKKFTLQNRGVEKLFNEHKGDAVQVDDVLFIGFEVGNDKQLPS